MCGAAAAVFAGIYLYGEAFKTVLDRRPFI